jgi:hypothetical protein
MKHPETFSCDICGKQKASVNHWFKAWAERNSNGELANLTIAPWGQSATEGYAHLCGQEHVVVWVSQQLGLKAEAAKAETAASS